MLKYILALIVLLGFVKYINHKKYLKTKQLIERKQYENLKQQTSSQTANKYNTLTNRKQAIFDYNTHQFDLSKALLKQTDGLREQLKNRIKETIFGQNSTNSLLQVFYSHDEFDKFSFIKTSFYEFTRNDVETMLRLKSGKSYQIVFPFAIKIDKYSFNILDNKELSEYLMTNEFSSLNHSMISEIGWYYIWSNQQLRNKLFKYRYSNKISKSVIDKFISLYTIDLVMKKLNISSKIDFNLIINDIEDNDLSSHIDDFRNLNSDLTKNLQFALK